MNSIFEDKQQFKQYQQAFRQRAHSKQATAEDHILYNLIRGKDLKRGFTPITNENKLNSNYNNDAWYAFRQAKSRLEYHIKNRAWFAKNSIPYSITSRYKDVIGDEPIGNEPWDEILKRLQEIRV